jgi:two-component system nitrogen regulation sensor histidine kinase NtrY
MGKSKSHLIFAAAGLLLITISFVFNFASCYDIQGISERASKKIDLKSTQCNDALVELLANKNAGQEAKFYELFEKENIGLYLLKSNGSGVFWNNSQIPLTDTLPTGKINEGIIKVKRGTYLFRKIKQDSLLGFSLCLIKPDYEVQNNHLKNKFSDWMDIPEGIEISTTGKDENAVRANGNIFFYLSGSEEKYIDKHDASFCTWLFILGCVLFFAAVLAMHRKNPGNKQLVFAILPLLFIKIPLFFGYVPTFLEQNLLFDLRVFADARSALNTTLGDIIFNSCALLYISLLFYFSFFSSSNKLEKNIKLFLLFLLAFLASWQFDHCISSLISNSTLSFDFLNVFSIKPAVVIALLSLVLNSISLFILLYRACSFFNRSLLVSFAQFMACAAVICILLFLITGSDLVQCIWPLLFSAILFTLVKLRFQRFSLGLGILIAFMSATSAGLFNKYIGINQRSDLKRLSEDLSERRDAYLENEFSALPQKIQNDKGLEALISVLPQSKKEVALSIKTHYFRGYFNTYNVDLSMFDKDCKPLIDPSQAILTNEGFFEDQIKFYSDSTFSDQLFFVKDHVRNTRYIGKIKLEGYNLYILLEKKQFEEQGSFPDLLLDQSQQKHEKLKNLPHAVYRSGQRTYKYGELNYPYNLIDSLTLASTEGGFIHHFFSPDKDTSIIISEKEKDWKYFFTYNSYLFLFFSLVSFMCYYLYALCFTANFKSASLTRRIQTIIILLLLVAMSAVGLTSGNLVSKQFEADNVKQLQEKTQAILSEFSNQFKSDELFSTDQKEVINLKLKEFAALYNSDISLFDAEGGLFNTSQPKLYELGLAAPIANPEAFFALKANRSSSRSVTEKAGTLNFQSLYTPIFNDNKKLIGFVNLPYFAKQSDLTNELSGIISALINVYVILFVLSIVAGLILAGYITKPLRLIKEQISGISLGKQNETLKWESNDEVGKLVHEYNNMLLKLEQSANLLAQSERESAWREMAKQVAHEIKNPLTPMKLNLQYLQHVMKSNPADFSEKFEKASASIIEQIDTLAMIATEFGNFAKLPGAKMERLNLIEIIHSSVNLFDRKEALLSLDIPLTEMWVMGDKEQLLRVFNNVIKNAVQAVKEVSEPIIRITAEVNEENYVIRITDNGSGIADEMKGKIFTPNFTTKSTGSGLGLAMVKNIISNFGGRIWFESEKDKGSTFYIEFRKTD